MNIVYKVHLVPRVFLPEKSLFQNMNVMNYRKLLKTIIFNRLSSEVFSRKIYTKPFIRVPDRLYEYHFISMKFIVCMTTFYSRTILIVRYYTL